MLPDFDPMPEGAKENADAPVFNEFAIHNEEVASYEENAFEWNTVADPAEPADHASHDFDIERGFTFDNVVAEELSEAQSNGSGDDDERKAAMRAQELESVDFYIAQGYADIAIDTLNLLESQFGKHPDIDTRRQQLAQGAEAPAVTLDLDVPDEPEISLPAADFSFVPEHNGSSLLVDHEPLFTNTPAIDAGLAEVFEEYRVSAEAETNGNGDYETHYNLGLAYQEMELFEEALEEFQIAIGLVSPEDGTPRYLQCCNLLGHCFMMKGVPRLAVKWFNKGLGAPNTSDDERQALRFDLAAAYEQAGDLDQARNLFTEIYGVNVSYRGVNERLKSLESRMV
jgi:tetratricopeptide (TPR) repeat protein